MRPRNIHCFQFVLVIASCAILSGSILSSQAAERQYAQISPTPQSGSEEQAEVDAAKQELNAAKATAVKNAPTISTEDKNQARASLWSPELVCKLSLGIGMFAIILLACVTILLRREAEHVSPEQLLRTFGILVIIFAAIFLVIAGYSDTQITPVIGLLGTIAGYLLGRKIEPPASTGNGKGASDETKH
jgi:Flp pilus assembly protein TadB